MADIVSAQETDVKSSQSKERRQAERIILPTYTPLKLSRIADQEIVDMEEALSLYSHPELTVPIKPGQVFDPQAELKTILQADKEGRKARLELYKEKLLYQRKGYVELRNNLIHNLLAWSFSTKAELQAIVDKYQLRYGFPPESRRVFAKCIEDILRRQWIVDDIRELLKSGSNAADICNRIFGYKPRGEVKVTTGPVTINFQFNDPYDFGKVGLDNPNATDQQINDVAQNEGGVFCVILPRSPKYNGCVILLNGEPNGFSSPSYLHEQQHAFHNIFMTATQIEVKQIPEVTYSEIQTEAEAEKVIIAYLVSQQYGALCYARDEILAFIIGHNFSGNDVLKFLTETQEEGGLYDYTYDVRRFVREAAQEEWDRPMQVVIDELVNKILIKDYKNIIQSAIRASVKLRDLGYPRIDVVGRLMNLPLQRWEREVQLIAEDYVKAGAKIGKWTFGREFEEDNKTEYTLEDLLRKYTPR